MRTHGLPSGQLFPKRWPLSNPKRTKSIMNKHKVKHHRNSDTKTGSRDYIRLTALEQSVINYCEALTSFTRATSPSVTDVVQTFSWLFSSHDKVLLFASLVVLICTCLYTVCSSLKATHIFYFLLQQLT